MRTFLVDKREDLQLLVVGNNPTELSKVLDRIGEVRSQKIVAKIAFDLKSSLQCLTKFNPSFILIDDNIGRVELRQTMNRFLRFRKTKHAPITILKNSNYQETVSEGALNYILKSNLTGELLYKTLVNSLTNLKTQRFIQLAYKKRKGQLLRMIKG